MRPKPSLELQMKTARNRIGEVVEGWLVVAQPRQHRGVLLYEIQHVCGVRRTVYPQDWQRGFVACPKCKYDRTDGVAARTTRPRLSCSGRS